MIMSYILDVKTYIVLDVMVNHWKSKDYQTFQRFLKDYKGDQIFSKITK